MRKRSSRHTLNELLERRKLDFEVLLVTTIDEKERGLLGNKISEINAAIHMNGWLQSADLRPPT